MLERKSKTFGRKSGRMSKAEKAALEELLPGFLFPEQTLTGLATIFGREAPTFVEIGFGSGDFIFNQAVKHPEFNYIGIEIYLPGIAKLLRKIQRFNATARTGLDNIRIARHEALVFLREYIPPHSLSGIYILFPDPWPKKRHHKRRLINPSFAGLLKERLIENGFVVTATDHPGYAEVIRESFLEAGFRAGYPDSTEVSETKYARKALTRGGTIHCLVFEA